MWLLFLVLVAGAPRVDSNVPFTEGKGCDEYPSFNAKGDGLSAFDYQRDGHGFATIVRKWIGGLRLATGAFP